MERGWAQFAELADAVFHVEQVDREISQFHVERMTERLRSQAPIARRATAIRAF